MIPARDNSHPASNVSANGTGTANSPDTRNTSNPSTMVAPAPPKSSGVQAWVSPDSSSADQSGAFQLSSAAFVIVRGSHRSWKIRVVASIMMLSSLI